MDFRAMSSGTQKWRCGQRVGSGSGIGSPKRHPWVTQASPKGHAWVTFGSKRISGFVFIIARKNAGWDRENRIIGSSGDRIIGSSGDLGLPGQDA